MAWYDYVPGVSNVAGAVKGDPLQAIAGPVGKGIHQANDYFFTGPGNQIKDAYDKAAGMSQGNMKQLMDFYMQQQGKAQGFYKPLQDMFTQAYGTGGIQAPQTPQAPGVTPLKSMYEQGKR